MPASEKVAAIDVGTNSFHLVIVQFDEKGRYEIIAREKESVRLGSGAGDMDNISPEAMDRGIAVLKRFSKLSQSMNANLRAVATSAVREAGNQKEFIQRVLEECDLTLEVAPGVEEARLIYLGALQALPIYDKRALLIDIGGGSTEFLVGRGGETEYAISLKLGAIRLTERFFKNEPLDPEQVKECRKQIRVALARVKREIDQRGFDVAVGSSGTIDTLSEMALRSSKSKKDLALSERSFSLSQLNHLADEIISRPTSKERMEILGLDEKRADIIVAGVLILQESFRALGIKNILFSPYALREGIIFDTLARENISPKLATDIRAASVQHLAESFSKKGMPALQASKHISKLALCIFEELSALGILPEMNRQDAFLLESAGILHNIGIIIAHSGHHKHGYYIIKNSEQLLGFSPLEIETLALLTRYHRKALPSKKHQEFTSLPAEAQKKIEYLGSILRIAIGLERGGKERVKSVRIAEGRDGLIFNVIPTRNNQEVIRDVTLEIWAARTKAEWFEQVYKTKTEFRLMGD